MQTGKTGSSNSLKNDLRTPDIELIELASAKSASGSSPATDHSNTQRSYFVPAHYAG